MKQAFINCIMLDGTVNMAPIAGKTVLTDGEKIEAIVDDCADFTGYEIHDLSGSYLMPGLVNMHVHLAGTGKPQKKQQDNAKKVHMVTATAISRALARKMVSGYAKTQLLSGVTTLRAVGGILDFDTATRDKINAGQSLGPRIIAANMAVSVPGGHMAGSLAYEATSPEEATNFVKKIASENVDIIKIMITGGVLDAKVKGEPGAMKMRPEIVKAACYAAHEAGLIVAAHVESTEGVRVALQNGVDTIEHGATPDDEIIELFKTRKASLVTTLSPALPYALFDRSVSHASEVEQFNGDIVFKGIIDCSKACIDAGIPVGLGTDTGCPFTTQYDMWREVHYFKKFVGATPQFALHTATLVNAQIAGLGDVIGSIEPGKCADMIVCKNNPLGSFTALRDPEMVVTRGKVIHNPHPKKLPEVERELDLFL